MFSSEKKNSLYLNKFYIFSLKQLFKMPLLTSTKISKEATIIIRPLI